MQARQYKLQLQLSGLAKISSFKAFERVQTETIRGQIVFSFYVSTFFSSEVIELKF